MLNTMFDVAFSVNHEGDPKDVPASVLLDALQQRINYLRANPQEAAEAFGISDSYEVDLCCSICGETCDPKTVHFHQGDTIGDECCWDERLRSSE